MIVRRVVVAVALVLATILALLAHAVLSVGDARAKSHAFLAPLATHLVPTRSPDEGQQAVRYLLDRRGGLGTVLRRHSKSRAILAKLSQSGRPADRSWAANLLGAVAVQDSSLDRASAMSYQAEALTAFRLAIHLDAGNEDPKFNLELLLTLDRVGRPAQRPSPQRGRRSVKRARAHHREPGFGY